VTSSTADAHTLPPRTPVKPHTASLPRLTDRSGGTPGPASARSKATSLRSGPASAMGRTPGPLSASLTETPRSLDGGSAVLWPGESILDDPSAAFTDEMHDALMESLSRAIHPTLTSTVVCTDDQRKARDAVGSVVRSLVTAHHTRSGFIGSASLVDGSVIDGMPSGIDAPSSLQPESTEQLSVADTAATAVRPVTCRAVLCCAVLCCAVLCCAVLCCAVLCCAVLCCAYCSLCGSALQSSLA
jgi:hypothetical protein